MCTRLGVSAPCTCLCVWVHVLGAQAHLCRFLCTYVHMYARSLFISTLILYFDPLDVWNSFLSPGLCLDAPLPEILSLLFTSSSNLKNIVPALFSHCVLLFSFKALRRICYCTFISALTRLFFVSVRIWHVSLKPCYSLCLEWSLVYAGF